MDTTQQTQPPTTKDPVGHVFAVPLGGGQWGIALVAFSSRRLARCNDLRVFYFDHVLDELPPNPSSVILSYAHVAYITTATDEALRRGGRDISTRWIDLGMLPDFRPEAWPEPVVSNGKNINVSEAVYCRNHWILPDKILNQSELTELYRGYGLTFSSGGAHWIRDSIAQGDVKSSCRISERLIYLWKKATDNATRLGLMPASKPLYDPPVKKTKPRGGYVPMPEFWTCIAAARAANPKTSRVIATLRRALVKAGPKGLREFQRALDQSLRAANTWTLWGAAYLANDGCSDDGFLYFRAWLITQGKEVFERTCADPDTLTDVVGEGAIGVDLECEELLDLVEVAAGELGVEPPGSSNSARESEPKGKQPDFDDDAALKKWYPKLFAKCRKK